MVTIMSENFAPMRTGTYPRKATMTRILIVEDEESYREPLVYQLTREGYDVSAAATGEVWNCSPRAASIWCCLI